MISKQLQEKIDHSYEVLRLAAEMSMLYYQKPLLVTESGGKDSQVLVQLCLECLEPSEFEVINSHTTVDAPETVYFIRDKFKELEGLGVKCSVHYPTFPDRKPLSMWNLIPHKGIPPTRIQRYCCQQLKEISTPNRFVALGVREAESVGRRGRDDFATRGTTKKNAYYYYYYYYSHVKDVFTQSERERERLHNAPNDSDVYDCKFIEQAKQKKELLCNAIYKWTDADVWDFIRDRGLKYNPLYDKGFKRVGCIGCPLSTKRQLELELYPVYKENYKRAFKRMLDKRKAEGKDDKGGKWKDVESLFKWWIQNDEIEGQMSIFDFVDKD